MFGDRKQVDSGLQALFRLNASALRRYDSPSLTQWLSVLVVSCVLLTLAVWTVRSSNKNLEQTPQGCRKLGLVKSSNITDQYDRKYTQSVPSRPGQRGPVVGTVKALFIHPIKSCASVELGEGTVVAEGMQYDRQFAFAIRTPTEGSDRAPSGSSYGPWAFLTQRAKSKLARVNVDAWVPEDSTRGPWAMSEGCIVAEFPCPNIGTLELLLHRLSTWDASSHPMLTFTLPWQPTSKDIDEHSLTLEPMRIWKDNPVSLNVTNMVPEAIMKDLKTFLNVADHVDLGLFRVHNKRDVFRDAPAEAIAGYQPRTGFQDGYPLHLNNLASIRDLAARLPTDFGALTAVRYRANFLITGPPAYAEDTWKKIRVGAAEYWVVSRNPRCPLPNVNPDTGLASRLGTPMYNQPLKTLKSYRVVDRGSNSPMLGLNMVPASPDARPIRVGDEIEVLETGEHVYTPC